MTRLRLALAMATILLSGSACAGKSPPAGAPATDRETLTAEELGQRSFYSAYEAVEALRPLWLSRRGPDGAVQVYVDNNHLGGVEALRTIRIASVAYMKHMDGIQAGARYGRGHEQGVILVTTRAAGH